MTEPTGETVPQLRRARPINTRLAIGALIAVLAFTAAPAVEAPPAQASAWMRTSCINPDKSPAPSEGWTGGETPGVSSGSTNNANCSTTVPMYAALSMASPAANGASEYLQYTPPAGSTLIGGSLLVGLAAHGYGYRAAATAAMFTPQYKYDATNVFLQCVAILAACQNGDSEFQGVVELPQNRGGNLYLGAGCQGQNPGALFCTDGGARGVWSSVAVSYANLLLSSSSLPTGADFAGSLLTPGAHGTAVLTFTAADEGGPGVLKAIVTLDGRTVYNDTPNTNSGKCAPVGTDATSGVVMWQSQQPCPKTQTVTVAVDTTGLADGEHELKVTLQTAAANSATVLTRTITTNNLTTISGKLTSDVPPPGTAPEPKYAIVLDAATQKLVHGVRRGWAHSALTLSGTLRNSSGVPAPGVTLTLATQDGRQGERATLARTTSDAGGHWVLKAPRGPTRTLSITYGSASKSAIAITETVKPAVTLAVKSLGAGRLRFTGRLSVKPLGSPLPLIVIQARNGKRFQAVGRAVRVTRAGKFTLTYNGGRAVIGGSYAFRAVAPATRYFTTGTSPIRRTVAR